MGAGRKPKPTRLKLVAGNPGKRPINEAEPEGEKPEEIIPPDTLTDDGKAEYIRVGLLLREVGVLTTLDLRTLELYAETYAQWLDATQRVHDSGLAVRAPSGFPIQNPYLSIANQAAKRMQSLLSEFGMTPASRTRIQADPKNQPGEFDGL